MTLEQRKTCFHSFQKMRRNLNQPKKPLKKSSFLLLSNPFHLIKWHFEKTHPRLQNLWSYMNRNSHVPNYKGVKFYFWMSFCTHFTLLSCIFIRVWPEKDPPLFEILTSYSKPTLLLQPPTKGKQFRCSVFKVLPRTGCFIACISA